ncbi:TonB-dependent receptor [Myxococcaceae bacterium GXIMD 01537]
MKSPRFLKQAGLLALCLCAGEALADARLEARRHFRNGMALIAQGQFDAGVAELLEAYVIKPHPNVHFNIARAYVDAGRLPEAVEYYRLYLSANPPDSDSVRATLARLEATLRSAEASAAAEARPAQQNPGALGPVLTGPGAAPAPGYGNYAAVPMPAAPAASAQDAQALAALMERLEKAVARAESLPAAGSAGPAEAPASGAAVAQAGAGADDGAVPYEERVVTASRRAQSTLEAPNATTVITAEDIRLSGASTLFELLRRVPGADVMTMGVSSANVSFRGFNQRIANKVLVLVDGRSEYQDFLGMTMWSGIPVGLEEIERIEVIRGPGSALYGANAMLGVVNIITQSPGTGPRTRFQATVGGGNTFNGSFLSHGATDKLRYRASVGYGQADKWSRDFEAQRPDVAQRVPGDADLGFRGARGNISTTYTFAPDAELGLSAGVNRYFTEMYPLGTLRNYEADGLSAYGKLDVGLGPLKLKTFWNHLAVDAGPQYEPIGGRSLGTRVTSNVFNGELLFSKGFTLAGEHLLNVGVEGRLKRVAFDYLGPLREELHAAAFVQDEWRVAKPLRFMASYRMDRHPLLDNGKPGLAHSPRVSALYTPWEGHAFRASAASAFRVPTFLESYTDLRVPVPGVNGASAITQGSTTLRPERLTALELGYRGEAPRLGIDWDVSLYQNTVKDLIGLSALQRLPAGETFDAASGTYVLGRSFFQNEDDVYVARGAEVGVNLAPIDGLGVKASASIQKVTTEGDASEQCGPCSQAPSVKLYGGVTYRTRADLEFGVDAAYTGSTTWIEREPAASDPTRIEFLANPLDAYAVINARVGYEAVKNKVTVAVTGSHLGGTHSQHPFGNRIERRVYATVTVTP